MKLKEIMVEGATFENAEIEDVSLNFKNYASLTLQLDLKGDHWCCSFGGYKLGHGYLGAKEFKGSSKGLEAIMRIMDTVGVEDLSDLKGKNIRVMFVKLQIYAIGNIIKDEWFTYDNFFKNENKIDD